ncbi:class I SAM-dependent methyltransferase [Nocardiopsis alba]|uniref:class I SAM-dependent methyltransferase n=1 Tax=Nocardiopsis alba TaxID=53437 RepID=UPI0036708D2E
MSDTFGRDYWERRYEGHEHGHGTHRGPNPTLVETAGELDPGTALEAGAGRGEDGVWLARRGWRVTAVDISEAALDQAAQSARDLDPEAAARITWVRADLTEWAPSEPGFTLVSSHYAHPTGRFERLVERLAAKVVPGGTLLIVGHDTSEAHTHAAPHDRPAHAHMSAPRVAAVLDPAEWDVLEADSRERVVTLPDGGHKSMRDAVVRARRHR